MSIITKLKQNTDDKEQWLSTMESAIKAYERVLELAEEEMKFKNAQIDALQNVLEYFSKHTKNFSEIKK